VEADAAKTSFLQARKRPTPPEPRVAVKVHACPDPLLFGEGLWRGHANQGRCQPGRRAVLEETSCVSDHFQFYPEQDFFSSEIEGENESYRVYFQIDRVYCINAQKSTAWSHFGKTFMLIFRGKYSQIRMGMITYRYR
jgi:hypothetical protein